MKVSSESFKNNWSKLESVGKWRDKNYIIEIKDVFNCYDTHTCFTALNTTFLIADIHVHQTVGLANSNQTG